MAPDWLLEKVIWKIETKSLTLAYGFDLNDLNMTNGTFRKGMT